MAGEGPILTVYSLHSHPQACATLSVLQHYRIHGIRPRSQAAVQGFVTGACTKEKDGKHEQMCLYPQIFSTIVLFPYFCHDI